MAVKQNNSEGNNTSTEVNQVKGGNSIKSNVTGTKSKKMNSKVGSDSSMGGVSASVGSSSEISGCSGASDMLSGKSTKSIPISSAMNASGLPNNASNLAQILQVIDILENSHLSMDLSNDMLPMYQRLILHLARIPDPRQTAEDLKQFKEDIAKVGAFFAKANDKLVYRLYLQLVFKLITRDDVENPPSYALAIIFQLFNTDMIEEAVESLLEHDVSDQSIRKTMNLLCEWLRVCNFCQNLNVWIMKILNGLQKKQKRTLFVQIALDNIEQLFASLIVPVFRPKVAPVVLHMLKSVDQTPAVFHKILPKFSRVVGALKQQQSKNTEEYADSSKKILNQLVGIVYGLMDHYYGYDNLYEPIEHVLKEFQSSLNYLKNASPDFDSDACTLMQNTTNVKVGLVNLGNTCYMNSVLQALAMTKEFSREILLSDSSSPLLIKMQQQIALMLYSSRHELTPTKVLNATRPPGFSPGLQQDSSEFLGYLLETLHEQEVAYRKSTPPPKLGVSEPALHECGASALSKYVDAQDSSTEKANKIDATTSLTNTPPLDQESLLKITSTTDNTTSTRSTTIVTVTTNSPSSQPTVSSTAQSDGVTYCSTIEKTFTGKLATTYKCLTCGWRSRNVDSFRDLQLSFPDVKNDCASNYSVQDLIEYYCSPEKLDGDNQYYCERCKKLSDAERYINVISAPKNLILTLKHFKYDQKYHMRAKLMHKVFHDEKVSVKVCSADSLNEIATAHYDLYAGVVHSGFSMDSGHYYTYAADAANKWYKFNDNIVTASKTEELHNLSPPNTPYILFYQMGARSTETPEGSASTKVIKVDVPTLLTINELPYQLRDLVNHDNYAYAEELKIRRYKNASLNVMQNNQSKQTRDNFEDDDDEHQPPPASGCGTNAINTNMNRFVY